MARGALWLVVVPLVALACARQPTPGPTPAPSTPPATALREGVPAPDFTITTLDGSPLRLSALRGRAVLLNFWASWCVPCREEMPALERAWREFRGRGVAFLGVAVSDREEDARALAEELGITYTLAVDTTGRVARAYRVMGLPTTYIIDPKGRVAKARLGPVTAGYLRLFLAPMAQGGPGGG